MDTVVNKNLQGKVKKVLAEDGTILFIGSGVSIWSGLPGWGQLLDEMADYVEKRGGDAANIRYHSKSQPLLAADFGYDALHSEDFGAFMRSACRKDVAKPSVLHKKLIDLGVSCYITTNYDRLLEQALKQNGLFRRYHVITNREPMDCASLLHLSRRNFVFKPHGDIEQIESIVLSNRQYNELYENGTRFYTYRALETLLTTRDVVFVGFGLTDPDFMRIVGKIRNEFRTNLSNHYAIMPDVSPPEKEYWANNYGIQILSYATKKTKNGRDYSALLELLDALTTKRKNSGQSIVISSEKKTKVNQKQRVALERYTHYLMQHLRIPDRPVIPLKFLRRRFGQEHELDVDQVLSDDMQEFILTGNPGAGKTFFLKQYCLVQAKRLQEWCTQNKTSKIPKIPVYINLKNYSGKGSIKSLIESQFPAEIPIMDWIQEKMIFLLFDSLNEVEGKYLENNSCAQEIRRYSYTADIIVAARLKESIDLHYTEFHLKDVKEEYVVEYLENIGIPVSVEEKKMVVRFLQKPLIFHLLAQSKIKIDHITPKSIYESYFKYLQSEIRHISDREINFISTFGIFAYDMVEKGVESFSLKEIEEFLRGKVSNLGVEEAKTLINWLIDSQQFLIPASLTNVSFFHQTITEFLAAHYFAEQFKRNSAILREKLHHIQWNYILLFAIGFLSEKQVEKYIEILLQTDSLFAIQACSYVEQGTNQIVTTVLEYQIKNLTGKNFEYQSDLQEVFKELPAAKVHQHLLRQLMEDKDVVGGAAAGCLLRAGGDDVKNELLEEMFQNLNRDNMYNYLSAIGEALSEKISLADYTAIVLRLGEMKPVQNEEGNFTIYGFDDLAQSLPLTQVVEIFQTIDKLNGLQKQLLAGILKDANSQESFDICTKLIRLGWEEAIFPLYLHVEYNSNICLDKIEESFIQYLIPSLRGGCSRWTIALIYALYQKCPPFARGIRARLKQSCGIERLAYLYSIGKNRKKFFFSDYSSMLYYEQLPEELIGAFDEIDWSERAEHIIEYLVYGNRLHDLSKFLEGNFDETRMYSLSLTTFLTLVKMIDEIDDNVIDDELWVKYVIGKFLAAYVREYNLFKLYRVSNQRVQRFFNFFVLNHIEDLELENFSESEINFMLEDIKHFSLEEDIVYNDQILLANIADEEFVLNRLKPFLDTTNESLRENIRWILKKAGDNQFRRYIDQ